MKLRIILKKGLKTLRDRAIFVGADGSMGFRRGESYTIELSYDDNRDWLIVRSGRLWCPYSNLTSLLKNWQVCGVKNEVNENIRNLLMEDKKGVFRWKGIK